MIPIYATSLQPIALFPLLGILPISEATPPNAVVYASNQVSMAEMIRAGLWLNLVFIILITMAAYTIIAWNFGIELGELPAWLN